MFFVYSHYLSHYGVIFEPDRSISCVLRRSSHCTHLSHIEDDDYFFNLLHHDLDEIMKDIRAAHAKDSDNTPDNAVADMIRKSMEDYQKEMKPYAPERKEEKPKKILMDQLFYYFTKELKMSRNKLTEEETKVLENLFMRSGRYKEEMRRLKRR